MGVLSVLNELLHYFICVVNEVILLLKIEPCMIASLGIEQHPCMLLGLRLEGMNGWLVKDTEKGIPVINLLL